MQYFLAAQTSYFKSRIIQPQTKFFPSPCCSIEITAAPVEESAVEVVLENFSNNLPLIGGLAVGIVMILGTLALRRNRDASGGDIEVIPDYLLEIPEKYGIDIDIMIEAKAKEQAIFKLYRKYPFLNCLRPKKLSKEQMKKKKLKVVNKISS